ncbi:MAG TPA: TetR/AcrR family transcriptional regulator [Propionicimonas sp.]|nr:TetR/AcrR family transcriptional regulator [Propionicimonas sp.]
MSTSKITTPQNRVPLTRERVLARAIALADESGLEAVSMRTLAAELGVVPMALYKHVANKDDLVSGMIDTVIAGYPEIESDLEWPAAIRRRIHAARRELLAHPWLRSAIENATIRTPTVIGYMDAVAGDFAAGGVSYDLTHYAMHALGHRIFGFSPEAFTDQASSAAPALSPEQQHAMATAFPHVAAIAMAAAKANPSGACEPESEFDFTLNLILDGLRGLHRSGWTSTGETTAPGIHPQH